MVPVCSQRFSVLPHLRRPHAEGIDDETPNSMWASTFPDVDLEAAFVVFIFEAGVVLATAVLLEQVADSVRFSLSVPPFTLLVSRVVHGGHSS